MNHKLIIENETFYYNGDSRHLWGIRTASATQSDELTDQLVSQLDEYTAYGINMISVFLMGSSGAASDPFSSDGREIDPAHVLRAERILRECDARAITVILGIFYQRVKPSDIRLENWSASVNAVRTVSMWLKASEYNNVILNIANEQNSKYYSGKPWDAVSDPDSLISLCELAKEEFSELLVGAGGYDHDKNMAIGMSPHVDVLLFDSNGCDPHSGELYNRFKEAGIEKPMVNVEIFGAWTHRFQPAGNYELAPGKEVFFREIDAALNHPGLSVTFFCSPWLQHNRVAPNGCRYDLGGSGTAGDPGIRWYFEYLKGRISPRLGKPQGEGSPRGE